MSEEKSKLSVFIGSSSEAKDRDILSYFIMELNKHYEVTPWDKAFDAGSITIKKLLDWTREADAAICLFTNDGETTNRNQTKLTVRDNVLFEYGLFLSMLGDKRVLICAEDGVDIPSDMDGVTVPRFKTSEGDIEHSIRLCCNKIKKSWGKLTPLRRDSELQVEDNGIGISETIEYYDDQLKDLLSNIEKYVDNTKKKMSRPFYFDSNAASLVSYKEGIDSVTERFWTSTFLSSGFWLQNEASIVESNKNLLNRLSDKPGAVRRLFIIECPIYMKADQIKNDIIHYRKEGDQNSIDKKLADIKKMKSKIQDLIDAGAHVRVVHDNEWRHEGLVAQMDFDPTDSELAIYDDRRLDIFTGGSSGSIAGVYIYSDAMKDFRGIFESADIYLSSLWDDSEEFSSFIEALEKSCFWAQNRIDYQSNWLAKYQYGLDTVDEELKTLEFARVKEVLRKLDRWGSVNKYLDIGTCTGRYIVGLRDAIDPCGTILGIDEDEDCCHFAKGYVEKEAEGDPRISILRVDFTSNNFPELGKFDLITCMLGTLSHFGWDRDEDTLDDYFEAALIRMREHLSDDGILVLGAWSNYAIAESKMLSIYSENDRKLLSKWTPSMKELEGRLSEAGLSIIIKVTPEPRLNMYFCNYST